MGRIKLLVHTAGDPTNLIPAIRREVYAVEPNLPLDSRQTQTEELKDQLGEFRSRAWNFTDLMACRSRIIPRYPYNCLVGDATVRQCGYTTSLSTSGSVNFVATLKLYPKEGS